MKNQELFKTAKYLISSTRPRQWLKNLSIFAPLVFWGDLFSASSFLKVSAAFFLFCAASGAAYLFNDAVDAEQDKTHPAKKKRPLAAGDLSRTAALAFAALLLFGSLLFSYLLAPYFFLIIALFAFLQIGYSLFLRRIIILDALSIAFGFILRVFAGAWVLPVPISSWLILATIGLSLLLAFGKRRSERTLLQSQNLELKPRETLKHYPDSLLDAMISLSSTYTVISYSLFSFQTSPHLSTAFLGDLLPRTTSQPKLMMATIPLVIYAVARYLYVIYEKREGESPENALLSDRPLLLSVLLWGILIILIIYFL